MSWTWQQVSWKKWKLMRKDYFTVPSAFLFLIAKEKCFCNKEPSVNIIAGAFGPIPVAVTRNQVKTFFCLHKIGCRKKWDLLLHSIRYLTLPTKQILEMA